VPRVENKHGDPPSLSSFVVSERLASRNYLDRECHANAHEIEYVMLKIVFPVIRSP